MTKAEIVREIALCTGRNESEIAPVINMFLKVVKDSLRSKNDVYLRGFGTFSYRQTAEKMARDIAKREAILVPAHGTVKFKPSRELKEALK